jgi:hypothetical protein
MNNFDVESLGKTMESMAQYELLLSDLYEKCAQTWPEDKDFWIDIAHQEVHHAENLRTMKALVTRDPIHFDKGRPLNPIAVSTAIAGLQDILKRLTAGEYSYERLLIIARDIENAVLEAHYPDIIKTNNVEYQTLMKSIMDETHDHSSLIQKKLAQVKSRRA